MVRVLDNIQPLGEIEILEIIELIQTEELLMILMIGMMYYIKQLSF